jgi:hypothetical protein
MISRADMMTPVLAVSPSFQPIWTAFVREWQDDPNGLPLYLALSDLARYIAELHRSRNTAEIEAIFDVVESWHRDGDAYVKEAAVIGLLEDLQNTNVVGAGVPEELARYLGPASARWWGKVEEFWERGTLIGPD